MFALLSVLSPIAFCYFFNFLKLRYMLCNIGDICVCTQIFERLPNYYELQKRLLFLEDRISQLLGGIQVIYIEELQALLTLEEYYETLDAFYNRLRDSRLPFHPRSLRGLQMILER